jgi:hypothetical protein
LFGLIALLAAGPLDTEIVEARPATSSYESLLPLAPGGPWLGLGHPRRQDGERLVYLVIDQGTRGRAEFFLMEATVITRGSGFCEIVAAQSTDPTSYFVSLTADAVFFSETIRVDYMVSLEGTTPSEVRVTSSYGGPPDADLPTEAPRLSVCRVRN